METAQEFGIEVLPTFLLVRDNKVLETLIGQDVDRVKTLVQKLTNEDGNDGRKRSSVSIEEEMRDR